MPRRVISNPVGTTQWPFFNTLVRFCNSRCLSRTATGSRREPAPEEDHMDATFRAALGRQFDAAIDMLENALVGCPDGLWTQRLWRNPPDEPRPSWEPAEFAEFWFLAYHALFWLDLYLTGCREEDFRPPAPFAWVEIDDAPP